MRHNPASGAVVIMLRQLKMHGMAQAVGELTEQGSPAFEAAIPILSQLLKAETAEREVRSTAYQLKTARFPAYRDLNGFDFTGSEINEALVRQLHRCDFLDDANNIVLVGGPGTGKTHIATAIGVQAIEHHHKRVRFFSTVELVNTLEQEKSQGRPGQIANRLAHSDLVILDELGYLPFSASGGALLFHLLSKLYEHARTLAEEAAENGFRLVRLDKPQLHGKFLAWDDDNIAITSLNWGSAKAPDDFPEAEIGIHLNCKGLAADLMNRIENLFPEIKDKRADAERVIGKDMVNI